MSLYVSKCTPTSLKKSQMKKKEDEKEEERLRKERKWAFRSEF